MNTRNYQALGRYIKPPAAVANLVSVRRG